MNCYLVTGATGAIGSALIPILLERPENSVRLLLRGASERELEQKLGRLFGFWGIGPEQTELCARVKAIPGDVCEPRLGIEENAYRKLCTEVTHLIHCAGVVKLTQPLEEARRTAVGSAREVVEFAEAAGCEGQFRKLEFVSTIGASGRIRGRVPEDLPLKTPGFRNTYEQSKSEAEGFVLSKIEAGLPITVHRPSMVVGDSKTGKVLHFQVFNYLAEFFSGLKTYGVVPDTKDVVLDIIPVDYVARAIVTSSLLPEAAGRVLHLCSGPDHAPRIADLVEKLQPIYQAQNIKVPRRIRLPIGLYRELAPLAARIAPERMRPMLRSLPLFLDYFADAQVFENAETAAFLSRHGVNIPRVDDYLAPIMDFYFQSKPGP
jgi:thioester reductase-like protein